MRIIIPAAGIGRRLKPHTNSLPKPLINVAGKPVLAHLLEQLTPLEPEELIFVVGYLGDQIEAWAEKNCSLPYSIVKQETLLGLGYAVWLALESIPESPVMIMLSDTLVETDLGDFVKYGKNRLGLKRMSNPSAFGVAEIAAGRVTKLIEKPTEPTTDLALVGLYYIKDSRSLKKHLADLLESDSRTAGEIQLTDALQLMIADGIEFTPWEVAQWYDCGDIEGLLATNKMLLQKAELSVSIDGSLIRPPVYIAEDAIIENSLIGPDVAVTEGVRISNSIVSYSIISRCAIIENSLVKDSIIAENSVISTGDADIKNDILRELNSEDRIENNRQ